MEGFIRDFHRLGNAPLPVEIVVQRLRTQSHPLSLQGKAVGHRHILADPAFRVAHILKQLPAVELVAGAGIAAVVAEDFAREGHAGKALVFLGAQADFLLAGFLSDIIAAAAGKLGIPLYEGGQERFVHLRGNPVVAVHKTHKLPGGRIQTGVSGRAETAVFFVNDTNSGIFFPIFVADFSAIVRRAVIHQKDFQIPVSLAENGVQAPGQESLHPVNGHNYADERIHIRLLRTAAGRWQAVYPDWFLGRGLSGHGHEPSPP